MNQLGKLSTRLKAAQVIEHCSFLFVVHENTNRYKFYGYRDLGTKFISGQPLSSPHKNKKNKYFKVVEEEATERPIELLTADKYSFPLGQGSGKSLAEKQKDELDNLTVSREHAQQSMCKQS